MPRPHPELVSELLQYLVPTSSILTAEAEAMLSGIYLDTKGFSTRTGVRTFEAAAYLRRAGAEASDVKRLFQSSFDQYMERQKIISSARNCGQGVIFAITGEQVDRIAAAQAADELLSIIGTTASVVAFRSGEHDMAVSARAAGQVNVQLLMERLGGGGNHSAAGAQLKNTTPEEADRADHRSDTRLSRGSVRGEAERTLSIFLCRKPGRTGIKQAI